MKDREIFGKRKRSKNLMLILGLNETIDQLAVVVCIGIVMC